MIKIIDGVREESEVFTQVQLEKIESSYSISIKENVESANDEEFRRAIKAMIEAVGAHLGRKKGEFISALKQKLGSDYVATIENYGLNFHILEMKFD